MEEVIEKAACPANVTLFEDICQLCEKLYHNKKNRPRQDCILSEFIDAFRVKVAKTPGTNKDSSFFPILRLLLPKLDRSRPAYDLKEDKLGKLYVKVLSLHAKCRDAEKLLNFRTARGSQHGSDFAGIACSVLQAGVNRSGDLTVGEVNDYLDRIANAEAGSKAQTNYDVFTEVVCKTTPLQHKWWVRIVLKDMKLEMGHNRILACFHPDAPEKYELCQDIMKICSELEQGDSRPAELGVELFSAVSPMLSERLDVTRVNTLPADNNYYIENKFDGERFQMHMKDGVFAYFSRRGHSYVAQYGDTYRSGGMLTPRLEGCFDPAVTSFILDGEMMGWHKEKMCFSSKGMPFDVKKITPSSKFVPCFIAFDILLHNGRCLAGAGGLPLARRLQLLDVLFADVPGAIVHSKRKQVENREDILTALNKAIEEDEEGVIVKDTNSLYLANKRNAGWYKVKPEYTEGAMVDLDLAVLGADYAQNSLHTGLAKSFFLALAVKGESAEMPQRWLSFGRVASGLTHAEKQELCDRLSQHWGPSPPPSTALQCTRDKPQLWIPPERSFVLQVKASELIRTTHYAAGYTLRFPRILSVRYDKPVKDAMTVDDLEKLVQGRLVEKLTGRQIGAEEVSAGPRPSRKRRALPPEVATAFRPAAAGAADGQEATGSRSLRGRKLAVLSGDEQCSSDKTSKQELEELVTWHGGMPVQNIGSDTWLCIAGRRTQRVLNAVNSHADVASADWLRRLPRSDAPCDYPPPLAFLSMCRETRARLARDYDQYGDGYTHEVDEADLRALLDKMPDVERIYLTTDEKLVLDQELFHGPSPFSCLRGCVIYIHSQSQRLISLALSLGALVKHEVCSGLTHAIWDDRDIDYDRFKEIGAVMVTEGWLDECVEKRSRVSECLYVV